MSLCIVCPSTGGHESAVKTWIQNLSDTSASLVIMDAKTGKEAGYLEKLQKAYEETTEEIICYFHSDLFIHERHWDKRVLREFDEETVGIVAFNGALQHGHPDIYKVPYDYRQLARGGFISNLEDAELHGARHRGEADVAVVDSFSVCIRRGLLDRVGGWPVGSYPSSHCSDYWASLMCHRLGYRVRYVGVACDHKSGGVRGDGRFNYQEWCKTTPWGSDEAMHALGHKLIYNEFRDVLPVKVG